MKKLTIIKEEPFKSIINEEYQNAKRLLSPLFKGINRSFVKFHWDNKLRNCGGRCSKHNRVITLNSKYRDELFEIWTFEHFRMTVRHEICHLIESNHGKKFKRYLELFKGHRYVGGVAYERPKKIL